MKILNVAYEACVSNLKFGNHPVFCVKAVEYQVY